MQLLVISPPTAVPHEAALASEMLAAGLARLHVRKPTFGHQPWPGMWPKFRRTTTRSWCCTRTMSWCRS